MNSKELILTEEMELELSNGKGEEEQYNYSKYGIMIHRGVAPISLSDTYWRCI